MPLAVGALFASTGELVRAMPQQDPPRQDGGPQDAGSQDPGAGLHDVTALDLDDLLNIRVISTAKREQVVSRVAAAVHVVRQEDAVRSGATSLPEALRMVPGMQVARTSANTWAVSARGFNDNLSNKLLVAIDGRSVYSPLHSGVFWDVQDVCFEDLDRIEVVRGPGGSLWGSNAINGIVNVITKPAEETLGGVLTIGAGTEDRVITQARYGVALDDDLHVRIHGKFVRRDDAADGVDPDERAYDGYHVSRGGFRMDHTPGSGDRLTLLGDVYDGRVRDHVLAPSLFSPTGFDESDSTTEVRGANLLSRWEHRLGADSNLQLQAYYDHTSRSHVLFGDVVHTLDVDMQHESKPADGHTLMWGLGYRVYWVDFRSSFGFEVTPAERTDNVASAFLQDEIALSDSVSVTLGCKVEHNDYSEFEFQPSGRIGWQVADEHFVWGAVTRAVRTPAIVDVDARLRPIVVPGPVPLVFQITGNEDFRSEELIAYEAGYRVRPIDDVSVDLAVFYNDYDHLRSGTPGTASVETSPVLHIVQPVDLGNALRGETYGFELGVNFQATPWWLLQASYSHLQVDLSEPSGEGRDPRHTVTLRSSMQLVSDFSLDTMVRYVSALGQFDGTPAERDVDAYVEATVRLGWQNADRTFEAALVGHDLVHEDHPEFEAEAARSEIQRGVYFQVGWRF